MKVLFLLTVLICSCSLKKDEPPVVTEESEEEVVEKSVVDEKIKLGKIPLVATPSFDTCSQEIDLPNLKTIIKGDQNLFKLVATKYTKNPNFVDEMKLKNSGLAYSSAARIKDFDHRVSRDVPIEKGLIKILNDVPSNNISKFFQKYIETTHVDNFLNGYYAGYLFGSTSMTEFNLIKFKDSYCGTNTIQILKLKDDKSKLSNFLNQFLKRDDPSCNRILKPISEIEYIPSDNENRLFLGYSEEYFGCLPSEVALYKNGTVILVLLNHVSVQRIWLYEKVGSSWKLTDEGRQSTLFPKEINSDSFINESYANANLNGLTYYKGKNASWPYLLTVGPDNNIIAHHKGAILFSLTFDGERFILD